MRYINVGSGSKGNSTIIYTSDTTVLIDLGVSKKRVVECLKTIGRTLDDVDGVLITHRHKDHTAHIDSFESLFPHLYSGDSGVIAEEYRESNTLSPFQEMTLKGLRITALPTSHDAPDSMGYVLEELSTGRRLMYMTDTGFIPFRDLDSCRDCDYYILESNHDPEMLMRSDRNNWLKMRIIGDQGHLSNQQCSHYLSMVVGKDTKEIALAHLSEECNTPELAVETFREVMSAQTGKVPDLILKTLRQKEPTSGGDISNE